MSGRRSMFTMTKRPGGAPTLPPVAFGELRLMDTTSNVGAVWAAAPDCMTSPTSTIRAGDRKYFIDADYASIGTLGRVLWCRPNDNANEAADRSCGVAKRRVTQVKQWPIARSALLRTCSRRTAPTPVSRRPRAVLRLSALASRMRTGHEAAE